MCIQEADSTLVRKAIQRDRVAFAALYDRYVKSVYSYVYYQVYEKAYAEDITQEVFIKAWKAIDRYQETGAPFLAWLTTIARNSAINHNHREAARRHVPLENIDVVDTEAEADLEVAIEVKLDQAKVRDAVLKLKGDKRQVILMHCLQGLSYSNIARALNKSEGAIRVIQHRALNDLKHLLNGSGPR
ncbi:MAG: RNA polymerase sigma factor [Chloroflexi bacterium]|nr:RNA polymerase sigma factor [Chloroflexota bacterium]